MHRIVDVSSTKGMSTHTILSSNDTSWCVICLTFIGNGFPELINNTSPGFTARGAGAPMMTLREEEETKTWLNAALLLQGSAVTTLLTDSQLLTGNLRCSDSCFSSAAGASSDAELVHTFAQFFLFISAWVSQLFSLLGGHIQPFAVGGIGPAVPKSCAGQDRAEPGWVQGFGVSGSSLT